MTNVSNPLHDHIEVIESGYEFLLAYAAQGREADDGSEVRTILEGMSASALSIIGELNEDEEAFSGVITDDARKAQAAMQYVLKQQKIGSELVDNLNASIHLRALLTDLFLVSEV